LKEVIVVAGANGSGKTTFAKDFVEEKAYYFVNADEIGATLEGQAGFQLKAGRIFFRKLKELVAAGQSFVMESTLSGGYLTRIVEQLRKYEYSIRIVYVFLENPESCIERVKIRVIKGGHHVAEEDMENEKLFDRFLKDIADESKEV
jgi:predicted ABC-type ATPase